MPDIQKTTWIFACHDYNRVSAMAALENMAQYFSAEYAIATVRNRFFIPEFQPVRFVAPNEWGAPNITAAQTSFDMDMTAINGRISQYLMSQGYSGQNISTALNALRGVPNPNLGILLLCVDLPAVYNKPFVGQPALNPIAMPQAVPEYRPSRALWASSVIFALTLITFLFFTLFKKIGPLAYYIDAYSLLIYAFLGCGLFMLLQKGSMYKLTAVFTVIICYILELISIQFFTTMTVDFRRLFNFSSPAYVQVMIRDAVPFAIVIVLGIIFMFLRMQIGEKLKITAWISSICIFIYSIITIIPQASHMPVLNLVFTIILDVLYIAPLIVCVYLLNSLSSIKRNPMRIGTGAIVWLSICIALTAAVLVLMIVNTNVFNVVSLIFSLLGITGYILIICGRRTGFLISVFSVSITLSLNIILYLGQNTLAAALSLLGLLNPIITWLLIRNAWMDRNSSGQRNYMQYNR